LLIATDDDQVVDGTGGVPEEWLAVAIQQDQYDLAAQVPLTYDVAQALENMLGYGVLEVAALNPDDGRTVGKAQFPGGEIDEKKRVAQGGLALTHKIPQFIK
jgi:hypothetical protein